MTLQQTARPRGLHPLQLALYRSLTEEQRGTYFGYLRSQQDPRERAAQASRQYAYVDSKEARG